MTKQIVQYLNHNNNIRYYDEENLMTIFKLDFNNIYHISTYLYPIDCLRDFNVIWFYNMYYTNEQLSELTDNHKYNIVYYRLSSLYSDEVSIDEYTKILNQLKLDHISFCDLIQRIDQNIRCRSTTEYVLFDKLIVNESEAKDIISYESSANKNNSLEIITNLINRFPSIINSYDIINYLIGRTYDFNKHYDNLSDGAKKYIFEYVIEKFDKNINYNVQYLIMFYNNNYNTNIIKDMVYKLIRNSNFHGIESLYPLYNLCLKPIKIKSYSQYIDAIENGFDKLYLANVNDHMDYYDKYTKAHKICYVKDNEILSNSDMKLYLKLLKKGKI